MADKYVDKNASGANDGTSWADAFNTDSGLQDAFTAMSSGDTIHCRAGTFADKLEFFSKSWTLKLYGDVTVDATGQADRTLHHNATGDGRIITDGKVRVLTLTGADSTNYTYYCEASDLICSDRVVLFIKGTVFSDGSTHKGMDFNASTKHINVDIPNLAISGFGNQFAIGTRGAYSVKGTIRLQGNEGQSVIYSNSGTTTAGTLTFYSSVIGGSTDEVVDTISGSGQIIEIRNSILYPLVDLQDTKSITDDTASTCNITSSDYYEPPLASGTIGTATLVDLNRNEPVTDYLTEAWLPARRPHYISLTTDDYVNFSEFQTRAALIEAKGWRGSIGLDKTSTVSAGDWATLQTLVDTGHDIWNHSRRETLWTENLYALTITATGTTCTIDVGADTLTLAGTSSGTLTLSSYADIDALVTALNLIAGVTAARSTTDVTSSNWGQSSPLTLADVSAVDVGSGADFALDADRHFTEEVTGGKSDIESNLSGFTCNCYMYVAGFNHTSHNQRFHDAGWLGCRATISNIGASTDSGPEKAITDTPVKNYGWLERYYVYNSFSVRIGDYVSNASSRADVQSFVRALVLTCKQKGIYMDLYAHGASETNSTIYGYVLDALEECNANIVTPTQAFSAIRAAGTIDASNNYVFERDFTQNDIAHLKKWTGVSTTSTSGEMVRSLVENT